MGRSTVKLEKIAGKDSSLVMTKLWLQARGHWEPGSATGAYISFDNVTVDGKAVSLPNVSTAGDFAIPFGDVDTEQDRIGRELTSCEITIHNPAYDTQLVLPLSFDYLWVPTNTDAVTLALAVSSEVDGNVTSMWMKSPRDEQDFLLGLRSTIVQLEFNDDTRDIDRATHAPTVQPWTVLIEDVKSSQQATVGQTGQVDRVLQLQIRRL